MTTNVLLNETGTEPLRIEGEYFILKRNDISYRLLTESKSQYNGEGYLILTSNRLVIFPTKQNTHFKAIDIPLAKIYQEEYKQPLFGKNYITAKCYSVFASPLGPFTFTIWFKGNHMGTLIGAFYTLLDSLRNNQLRNHDDNVMRLLRENNFNELFAIDPEDNSLIYQIQPPPANIPKQNYQSVIVNRPPGMNNFNGQGFNYGDNRVNNINFSQINEEQIKRNYDIYMSNFIYRNPNNNGNKFVYKDPGFVYKDPNKNNKSNDDDDDDLVSPYNPEENNNNRPNNNFNNGNNIPNPFLMRNNNNPNNYVQNPYLNRNIPYNYNQNINQRNNNIQNPYLNKNNSNYAQNPYINQDNSQSNYRNNIIQVPPESNQSYIPQNKMNLNQYNNNPNQMNNPYGQIMNQNNNNRNKEFKNNNQYKNVNKGPLSGKYQNLKEENDDELGMNNQINSINDSQEIDDSNVVFENNQDISLLNQQILNEDIVPNSNVSNPYE